VGELSIEIAGLRTGILTEDPEVAGVVRERYQGFLSAGTPGWRIAMQAQAAPTPSAAGEVVVTRHGDRPSFAVQRGDFAGTLDLRHRCGTVTLREPSEVSIDSFIRIAYSLALLEVRGLLLHAASLIRGGRAYLFCGPSGSGKTTVARLSPDATLLSEELSVVRVAAGRALCYGTPFQRAPARGGEDGAAPLAGVYFLRHGSRHAVQPTRPAQALGRLLPNVLFFARDAEVTGTVFRIASDLLEAVPSFDLAFRPDPGFWEVIERA
jgi:hypothetical protein